MKLRNFKDLHKDTIDGFEQYIHEKFDTVELLLKDYNIEYFENVYNKQLENKGKKC